MKNFLENILKVCRWQNFIYDQNKIFKFQKFKYIGLTKAYRRHEIAWYENPAPKAESAAANKDMKLLYDITKEISGRKRYQLLPIKDVHGNLLTSTDDQVKRFKEHFNSILNNPDLPPSTEPTMPPEHMMIRSSSLSTTPPEMDEIINAIQAMKNNKSPGVDNITVEMLKACPNTTAQLLHPLFSKIWETETLPEELLHGILVTVPKKDGLSQSKITGE